MQDLRNGVQGSGEKGGGGVGSGGGEQGRGKESNPGTEGSERGWRRRRHSGQPWPGPGLLGGAVRGRAEGVT